MAQAQIAITGAAGFIGSRLLEDMGKRFPQESLLAVDHPVPSEKRSNLAVTPNAPFMGHAEFLEALDSGRVSPDIIWHMGACSSTTEQSWPYLADNNLGYSQRLWQWCARHSRRLIYASSAATYGDGSRGFDDEAPIRELEPLNLYGRSKHEFDLWVEDRNRAGVSRPAQCVGLKFFNVFGPGEAHKGRMASMVFHGYNQIRQDGEARLFQSHKAEYPDGGQLRDFIYVGDIARVARELEARPNVSGLFNLGTGQARSFRELIEAVFAALRLPPRIRYVPMPEDLQGKYQYFTEAKMRKLAVAGVPYAPTPLEGAVAEYVAVLAK